MKVSHFILQQNLDLFLIHSSVDAFDDNANELKYFRGRSKEFSIFLFLGNIKRIFLKNNKYEINCSLLNFQVQRHLFTWHYCHQMLASRMENLLETRRCKCGNPIQDCIATRVPSWLHNVTHPYLLWMMYMINFRLLACDSSGIEHQ